MDMEAPKRLKSPGGQGSHNKPIGCGASGAYAPDPDDEEEECGVTEENVACVLMDLTNKY